MKAVNNSHVIYAEFTDTASFAVAKGGTKLTFAGSAEDLATVRESITRMQRFGWVHLPEAVTVTPEAIPEPAA